MTTTLKQVLAAVMIGVAGALVFGPQPMQAALECERNACRVSTGNCDLTDAQIECMEVPGSSLGCWSNSCSQT